MAKTMTRSGQILMMLLFACLGAAATADEEPQPPADQRNPDRPGTSGLRFRYGFAAFGGLRALQIDSRLFGANEMHFGITEDDFDSGRLGLELDFAVLPMVEILVGFDIGQADTRGSYLDAVGIDGSTIEHAALLSITDHSIGARIRPLPERRASPYLVVGLARTSYEYSESGLFVDSETSGIYFDELGERQSLMGFFAGAGLDVAVVLLPFERRVDLFGEIRYNRNQGSHADDFSEFGDLNVARTGALFGFRVRF